MATKAKKKAAGNGAAKSAEAMVFERAEPKVSEYDRISARVCTAVDELNAALEEAHKCAEMRVFLGYEEGRVPAHFKHQIYRLTHATFALQVSVGEAQKPMWQLVKDPAFKVATGGASKPRPTR